MANDVNIVSATPQVYVRYVCRTNSQSSAGNYSNITVECWALIRNGSRTGSWDWNAQLNGTTSGSNASGHSGDQYLGGRTLDIGHDADGNLSVYAAAWLDAYYGSGTAGDWIGIAKIYRSAGWSSSSSSNVKSTTATVTNTVSDWGIGSSHGHKIYYRVQGSGSGWSATSDVTNGTNPASWNLTGLQPGQTYEYYSAQWNNNTAAVNGTTYTFKTLNSGMMLMTGEF
jgi:hypothetical protein